MERREKLKKGEPVAPKESKGKTTNSARSGRQDSIAARTRQEAAARTDSANSAKLHETELKIRAKKMRRTYEQQLELERRVVLDQLKRARSE
ncbi:unnamed protein product, partial [Amoebophrya sp. A120]|eukprot:GSA120T00023308001.1